jgi:arylsulfatase A-like enzyme
MMKPNLVFLTIDSLRADKCHESNRKTKTPNLDSLVKKGTYFSQAISTADQTGTSLATLFTGIFPTTSGKSQFNFTSEVPTYFDILKQNGYQMNSFIPDHEFFISLTSNFDKNIIYEFKNKEKWLRLQGGLGDQIIQQLRENKTKSPWVYYIHLMDIRAPFLVPTEFNKDENGENNYEKLVSYIDTWIGKFSENINFDETLFVLSSDHGEYIPFVEGGINGNKKIEKTITEVTKKIPFLEKAGIKMLLNARFAKQTYEKEKLKRTSTPYQMRSLNSRSTLFLYDELIRVPLLFVGHNTKNNSSVLNMVRHADVFPTIMDILKISSGETSIDGQSLYPLIQGENITEKPAYIEVGVNLAQLIDKKTPDTESKVIGIRTSDYKYFRSREDNLKLLHLYDLKNDPLEENNIAELKPDIVKKLEQILIDFMNRRDKNKSSTLTDEEIKKAKETLLKLGYI